MSTLRTGREIRSIVEQARALSGSGKPKNYDMVMDDTTEDPYMPAAPEQLPRSQTMPADVTALRKQLHVARAEADDMKQKYNALKRNYESVTYHSQQDSIDNVRLNKLKAEFDS